MTGAALFSGPCDFVAGADTLDRIPDLGDLPEIAFAGRSNVGKSSLINALTGRKTLARTSNTPGRTQQLNFFNLGDRLCLVDMPGYGYAEVSKAKKRSWETLIRGYLRERTELRCVFVLVDGRHGLKDSDRSVMDLLRECAVPFRIAMTKSDKVGSAERAERESEIVDALRGYAAAWPTPVFTSAEEKEGIDELRETVLSVAGL